MGRSGGLHRRAKYAGSPSRPKGRAVAGRITRYPFSGLLVCACGDTPMVICGGSSQRYWGGGDITKRGICENRARRSKSATSAVRCSTR